MLENNDNDNVNTETRVDTGINDTEVVEAETKSDDFFVPSAMSDPGCERELNEDRYAVIESDLGLVWIVCDGMGGESGGELAAQIVIDTVKSALDKTECETSEEALKEAIEEANRVIVLRRQNKEFKNMGTTVVAGMFYDRKVAITGIGDSRVYLVSSDRISQLTEDHTYVQELVKRGEISLEDAMDHPQAHVLTKAIGSSIDLECEVSTKWIHDTGVQGHNDSLVMCSDGLYSLVPDHEIVDLVKQYPPQVCCAKLVELARDRGGYDNITVAIIPLGGSLHDDQPQGYELPKQIGPVVTKEKFSIDDLKQFIFKDLLLMGVLTVVFLVIVFLVVVFILKG